MPCEIFVFLIKPVDSYQSIPYNVKRIREGGENNEELEHFGKPLLFRLPCFRIGFCRFIVQKSPDTCMHVPGFFYAHMIHSIPGGNYE